MRRLYTDKNVYEAYLERMDFIFREFDNILVSFSGGKDSGLLLNMTLDFKRKYYPEKRIGLYHQDFEAQYSYTTEYVKETFESLKDEVEAYWVCLPTATRTALSNYEMFWYPWDDEKKDIWVRPMPEGDYVINIENNPISTYRYKMHQEDLAKQFSRWYASNREGKTVCLLGMRTDESLNRYNAILNKQNGYKGECYITEQYKNCWTASPIYDWSSRDVWAANAKFGYPYNKIYDLYFKAGLGIDKMRVASPFNEYAVESLNLYRVIEPKTWTRLVGRVRGVNFGAIYGKSKALGTRNVSLPDGYTWEEYTKFLLATLPAEIRNAYVRKFVTSIEFWHKTGGGLPDEVIAELRQKGYRIELNGVSNYTIKKFQKVVFVDKIPDNTDDVKSTRDIPSWKRMCLCILKNDHLCRSMGFGLSREQRLLVDEIKDKYKFFETVSAGCKEK
ncbi:MAG: DUF3440 domain-containing protein [Ruminococcaceae bacterium]|nr:DUF3440 domain-containing protein [Oscillospiraceae bacterium]